MKLKGKICDARNCNNPVTHYTSHHFKQGKLPYPLFFCKIHAKEADKLGYGICFFIPKA